MYQPSGETGVNGGGERTETGVMAHNVTFKVVTSKKLLQALPRHCHLKSQRTALVGFYYRFNIHTCAVGCSSLTCTMAAMSMGSMARGNRRMLKREMEVKAFSAVNMFSELTPTNTANVTRDTCKKKDSVRKKKEKKTIVDLLHLSFCEAPSQHSPQPEHS